MNPAVPRNDFERATSRATALALGALFLVTMTGCGIVERRAKAAAQGFLESVQETVEQQSDPEIVRTAFPTFLILIESAYRADPEDPELARAFVDLSNAYGSAFLVDDPERGVLAFTRAKRAALPLLERYDGFAEAREESIDAYLEFVRNMDIEAVPDLYAAGSAWLNWILASEDSMEALADVPYALPLLERSLELDERYQNGAAHLVFGIYYAAQPRGAGQDLDRARHHFDRVEQIAGPGFLLPRVLRAEFIGKATLDEDYFVSELESVLDEDLDAAPEFRLANALARERADKLLERTTEIF